MNKTLDFSYSLTVKASANETMKKISQVNLWWAKNFKGKASKLNDDFSVHFGDIFVDFRISEVIPEKKIIWLVTDCNLGWIKDEHGDDGRTFPVRRILGEEFFEARFGFGRKGHG